MVFVLAKQIKKFEIQELRRAKITAIRFTRWDSRQRLSNSSQEGGKVTSARLHPLAPGRLPIVVSYIARDRSRNVFTSAN